MTPARFILASLRHFRRIHLAVAAGVAVATAVLTGALLVGDSVRGSLRDLTLQRLGRIDEVLVAPHLFRAELAEELAASEGFKANFTVAEPALLLPGTLQSGNGTSARRATNVSIVGVRPEFWDLGQDGPSRALADDEIAISESLARELEIEVGTMLLVRVPALGAMPSDSLLGEKSDTSLARSLRVAEILPARGLARFGLLPSQQLPRNVFVPLATLQKLIGKAGRANAILVAGESVDGVPSAAAHDALQRSLRPRLEDFGVRIELIDLPVSHYQIVSDELVLPDAVANTAIAAAPKEKLQPLVTYLANSLVVGAGDAQQKVPYSTITGIDSVAGLGPLLDDAGEPVRLADDQIALNRWTADELGATIGDIVTVNYYEPESTHGVLREHSPPLELKLVHIAELERDGKPTAAADPHLTPELPGVTDKKSIHDWKLPFELVETIRTQDEDYWSKYRTTPKAFVSLATGERLWASRWGTISMLRLTDQASVAEAPAPGLLQNIPAADVGFAFLPVKRLGLEASSGTTPFDALFLGFSFFLIAAALMLIALLFKLGVEERARELGILAASGFPRRQTAGLLSGEGLAVAAMGATVGIVAGVFYAWLMIVGLRTWWVAAISTPFLSLHVLPRSLAIGWLVGVGISWLTIRWTIRRLVRLPAGRLLAGATEQNDARDASKVPPTQQWPRIREALLALAAGLGVMGYLLSGEAQAGVFFGSGATVLAFALGEVRYRLRAMGRSSPSHRTLNLASLAALNMARRPGRSTLTIGLVAAATFLIVSVSAFRLDTGDEGTGGFALAATSDQSIHFDLNTEAGRRELGFSDADSRKLDDWRVYSLRVAAGEDASCLNLYRPTQPRVLGVPDAFIERGGFGWAGTAKLLNDKSRTNKWELLWADHLLDAQGKTAIPVVLDAATAIYSLHLSGVGAQFEIRDGADRPVTLEVVGLLKNSVLQGNLLMSEEDFLRLFPETGGYRYFLVDELEGEGVSTDEVAADATRSVTATKAEVSQILESTLVDDGFDAVDAREQLAGLLAVQNTYLSTFQSLGALGLLLGTVGLAVVQLRSVLERRGELALMRASGFRRGRLVAVVLWENGLLLVGGLAVGVLAAVVALLPQIGPHGASVPWVSLAMLLGTIGVVGLVAGWVATRSALDAPLVPALRGE